jgi:hypothetical protein
MQPKTLSMRELRQVRTLIAVEICVKYPRLYKKLTSDKGYVMGEKEGTAAEVLKGLMESDPIIKRYLSVYFSEWKPKTAKAKLN